MIRIISATFWGIVVWMLSLYGLRGLFSGPGHWDEKWQVMNFGLIECMAGVAIVITFNVLAYYINEIMGNIEKESLDTIWQSDKAHQIREKIEKEKPLDAWMICTLRGSFNKNKGKILSWALQNKLKVHLGQTILQ